MTPLRRLIGLACSSVGTVLVLDAAGGLSKVGHDAARWWPLFFVGVGVFNALRLTARPWAFVGPVIFVLVGVGLTVRTADVGISIPTQLIAGVPLLIAGVLLAITGAPSTQPGPAGRPHIAALFRGRTKSIPDSELIALTAVAGHLESRLAAPGATTATRVTLHVGVVFGEVAVSIPAGWAVSMPHRVGVFVRAACDGAPAPAPQGAPTVEVRLLGLCGRGTIRYR